ncbi:MAG: DUF167 family protein [Beijerinckiaceae bacterium]
MSSSEPWRAVAGGLLVSVRLTPKGGRDAIDGIETLSDGRAVLKARVRAVPEDGRANDALVALIAQAAGVARSAVSVSAGHTSRIKTLAISGDAAAIAEAVKKAVGA